MAMSGTFKLSSNCVPGYTLSGSKNFSKSVVSRRTLSILPFSSCLDQNLRRLRCVNNSSSSLVCRASSGGGYRRNPDFTSLNKHGYQGRNMQNGERDDFDVENSEMLSSRNGPLRSLSNSPKFQETSSPVPREKEIVEVFRKVQAQLRARSATKKEGRKIEEASEGQGKESETVESLIKLLRKQSGEQSNSYPLQGDTADKQDRSGYLVNSQNKDYNAPSFTRPTSSFRRNSPVPRSKSPPAYSTEPTFDEESSYSVTWTQKKDTSESDDEPEDSLEAAAEYELEPDSELETESELKQDYVEEEDGILDALSDDDESIDDDDDDDDDEDSDEAEEEAVKQEDLSTLKLMELKGIAKSRGLKGFSKMKKTELAAFLGNSSNSS